MHPTISACVYGGLVKSVSNRASFWISGAVVAIALWTSACPTMVYPLYQHDWNLTTTTVAWIFAAYPLALVPVLIIFGNLSDHIGRRLSMLIGLSAQILGVLAFAFAPDITWLFAGRALMGLGVGLSISPASVAMVEFSSTDSRARVGAITTAVSSAGIALAMLIGGALTEYAPFPLRLNFWVLALVILAVGALVWRIPHHTEGETDQTWRTRPIIIPRGVRAVFAVGSLAFASSFLLGAIVLPLGAQIAHQLARSSNALITGSLLSVFAACIAAFSLMAQRLNMWVLIALGALGSLIAVWLFVLTGATHSLAVFFLASGCAGAAYAFDYAGGLSVFTSYAAPHHRASMVSGGFLVGYVTQSLSAPFVGWLATEHGLMTGLLVGSMVFSVVFLVPLIGGVTVLVTHRQGQRLSKTTQEASGTRPLAEQSQKH